MSIAGVSEDIVINCKFLDDIDFGITDTGDGNTINITTDNCEAVAMTDLIILAVKPFIVQRVVEQIRDCVDYNTQTVASIVGGLGSEQLDAWLNKDNSSLPPVYTIIPNTAIATLSSMTFISSKRIFSVSWAKRCLSRSVSWQQVLPLLRVA